MFFSDLKLTHRVEKPFFLFCRTISCAIYTVQGLLHHSHSSTIYSVDSNRLVEKWLEIHDGLSLYLCASLMVVEWAKKNKG